MNRINKICFKIVSKHNIVLIANECNPCKGLIYADPNIPLSAVYNSAGERRKWTKLAYKKGAKITVVARGTGEGAELLVAGAEFLGEADDWFFCGLAQLHDHVGKLIRHDDDF